MKSPWIVRPSRWASWVNRRARSTVAPLLDVLENLGVARLVADDEEPAARVAHRLERLVVRVDARGAGPREAQGLEVSAQLQHAVLADVEGVVVEEDLLDAGEVLQRPADLGRDVCRRPDPPAVPRQGLRPEAERAERRAAALRVERHIGVLEERDVVAFDLEVALVDRRDPRQRVKVGDLRDIGSVDDSARSRPEAHSAQLLAGLAVGEVDRLVVEFLADDEVNCCAGPQAPLRLGPDMGADKANLKLGIHRLHRLGESAVVGEARTRRKQDQELEFRRHGGHLRRRHLVRRGVHHPAVGEHAGRIAQPHRVPVGLDLTGGRPARARPPVKILVGRGGSGTTSSSASRERRRARVHARALLPL